MRDAVHVLTRGVIRVLRPLALVTASVGLLVSAAGTAVGDERIESARGQGNTVSLDVLGPVGLAAVVVGVVGMAAGVLRSRKRARQRMVSEAPRAPETDVTSGSGVPAVADAVLAEQSTEPMLAPVRPGRQSRSILSR